MTAPFDVITYFIDAVRSGGLWSHALVTAIGQWSLPQEEVEDEQVTYLVAGEAFDWLRLAERLLRELDVALPGVVFPEDRERLLFQGLLPRDLTEEDFRDALGSEKYRAHLNFFYGITVEEALWHAVELDILKERRVRGLQIPMDFSDQICERLYRANLQRLRRRFQRENGRRYSVKFSLQEWKSFMYWLFKIRIDKHDSTRFASDTNRGLEMLRNLRESIDSDCTRA